MLQHQSESLHFLWLLQCDAPLKVPVHVPWQVLIRNGLLWARTGEWHTRCISSPQKIMQSQNSLTWWRHGMETLSALLALCVGNSPVTCEFPAQRPVTRSLELFFDLCLNKRLSKQSWGWWFDTPSRSSWCHCNDHPHRRYCNRKIPWVLQLFKTSPHWRDINTTIYWIWHDIKNEMELSTSACLSARFTRARNIKMIFHLKATLWLVRRLQ